MIAVFSRFWPLRKHEMLSPAFAFALPATVWGNMPPPSYQVQIPVGREPLYEWGGPVFLGLAGIAIVGWYWQARNVRTGPARAWIWAAAGCLVIGGSVFWVWTNRDAGRIDPGWISSPIVYMPCVWPLACTIVIAFGWRAFRPRKNEMVRGSSTEETGHE